MEISQRQSKSYVHHDLLSQYYFKRQQLCLESHIETMLKMFSVLGIFLRSKPHLDGQKLKMALILQTVYQWSVGLLMLYFFAARVHKAVQPNVPLMLSFSETAATASSILLRFIVLRKKAAINKLLKAIHVIQQDEELLPPSSYTRREKQFFVFSLGGFLLTMCLCMTKAFAELLSEQGFQMYRKSYLFSAEISNGTLLHSVTNVVVFGSHLAYILNLYAVPSICILFCCFTCNGIGFFNLSFKTKIKDYPNVADWSPSFVKSCIFHFRKMNVFAKKAETALSTVLFFLYSYLLCSLFYIVSISIRK